MNSIMVNEGLVQKYPVQMTPLFYYHSDYRSWGPHKDNGGVPFWEDEG